MTRFVIPPARRGAGLRVVAAAWIALGALGTLTTLTTLTARPAAARPEAPRGICATASAEGVSLAPCQGTVPSCTLCHQGPPDLNPYGLAVGIALAEDPLYTGDNFEARVGAAVFAIGGADSDGDGLSNLEELLLGTFPGDTASHHVAPTAPTGAENFHYKVGARDERFAFRRVHTVFCGRPPQLEDITAFAALPDGDKRPALHTTLDACLASEYWTGFALPRLADKRIRPLESIGFDGLIPLADYSWDYRLFVHVFSGDRDLRDLLLADYHIEQSGQRVEGIIPFPSSSPLQTGGQPLPPERRAGMITTQWFLMSHTMFSALPRTTAAQAYRAYLGMDIALSEGIVPVDNEPRDVDLKGVQERSCAVCHSTLDPLSYAFSPYNGIGRLRPGSVSRLELTGAFDANRVPWGPEGTVLGHDAPDLRTWVEHAVTTDAFVRNLGLMVWEATFHRRPTPDERAEFEALWRAIPADGHRAERAFHRVVDSDAFGVP